MLKYDKGQEYEGHYVSEGEGRRKREGRKPIDRRRRGAGTVAPSAPPLAPLSHMCFSLFSLPQDYFFHKVSSKARQHIQKLAGGCKELGQPAAGGAGARAPPPLPPCPPPQEGTANGGNRYLTVRAQRQPQGRTGWQLGTHAGGGTSTRVHARLDFNGCVFLPAAGAHVLERCGGGRRDLLPEYTCSWGRQRA